MTIKNGYVSAFRATEKMFCTVCNVYLYLSMSGDFFSVPGEGPFSFLRKAVNTTFDSDNNFQMAVPRDVDVEVKNVPGVCLFDMDTLSEQFETYLDRRESEVPKVETIIAEEQTNFVDYMATLDIIPIIVEMREQTKSFLGQGLNAVITQNLIKTPDGRARRAILEIMVMTRAIAKMIATDQTHQIPAQLQTGRDLGMQLMDHALMDAIKSKQVDPDDAYRFATDKNMFQKFVTDTSMLPKLAATEAAE